MNLSEILARLSEFNDEDTIYAKEPWSEDSEAMVVPEPADGSVPKEAEDNGLSYFIEVFIAKEFLEGLVNHKERHTSLSEKIERLIQYADSDA